MIKQTTTGLNSRSEANPYNKEGFLPIITAPMYSVVDESNYQVFLDNKIQVCLPRGCYNEDFVQRDVFYSMSLQDFIVIYVNDVSELNVIPGPIKVCIDTANGNIPALHEAIRKAKEIHGNNLIIMSGNVASVEAFVELAKTGVDYIRCGIGGSSGCNTTSNTGVGQEDLEELIKLCVYRKKQCLSQIETIDKEGKDSFYRRLGFGERFDLIEENYKNAIAVSKVKIVADGISSYIKQCETKYGFNDNGYATINKLLFAGADLVMVGKLFAQCVESAGEKGYYNKPIFGEKEIIPLSKFNESPRDYFADKLLQVKYSGMSTLEEQKKYRDKVTLEQTHSLRPSEGSVSWIPVRFLLKEWIWGNESQDTYPYLMGFVNSLKSAMSYTGAKTLYEFKNGK